MVEIVNQLGPGPEGAHQAENTQAPIPQAHYFPPIPRMAIFKIETSPNHPKYVQTHGEQGDPRTLDHPIANDGNVGLNFETENGE